MSRNLKQENIKKLLAVNINGFKVDIQNYIYNPSHDYDYPSLFKIIGETEQEKTVLRLKYFKFYNGTGEYSKEIYSMPKGEGWHVTTEINKEVLEKGNRFSLKKLEQFAMNY